MQTHHAGSQAHASASERIRIPVTFPDTLRLLALALVTAALPGAFAQRAADEPRFEVASIKPSDSNPLNTTFVGMSADGAMVKYTNITLQDCIRAAYRVRDFQIAGPDWMTKAHFEITAKLPVGASADQIPEMLQALLAERFKLEIRREMKEEKIYALVVGKQGAKLKAAEMKTDNKLPKALGPDGKPREPMMYSRAPGGVSIIAPAASLASLVWLMSLFTARPVVDMTGIEGQYEFRLTFAPERNANMNTGEPPGPDGAATSAEPAPTVFYAVQQYGLGLEPRKAPIEILVVTHVERTPAEN
jgi:uncharacterized protein (TIGR03435 family)